MQRLRRHGTRRHLQAAGAPSPDPSAHRRLAVVGLVVLAVGTVGITASSPLHGREAARPATSSPAGRPDRDGPDGGARAAILRALPGGLPHTGPPRGGATHGDVAYGASGASAGTAGAGRVGGPAGLEPGATSVVLVAAGDIDLSRVTDPRTALARLRGYGTSADLALCRLVAPGPRAATDALAAVGLDQCATDAGTDAEAATEAITVRDMSVTVLRYRDDSALTADRVAHDAERARDHGADLVIVQVHWGHPGQATVTAHQRALARDLLASPAVDLILGAGSGGPLPVERVAGRFVAYDLGTALGPTDRDAAIGGAGAADPGPGRVGLLLTAQVRRTALGWLVAGLTYTPTWSDPAGTACWPIADALDDHATSASLRRRLNAAWHRVIAAEGTLGSTDGVRVDRLPRDLAAPP
ncbi:conserved hypothetical protein [Frankia canadensis]|uniref:Capsule synthesis protein CapA domain-containing protein n=1 Tax=Frankia canadensis TaxID=1836972 RepID=A0A2I2KL54_9ACTN|nr:CapA family protein [Frankia canadensis]SNQ46376.1 conserved hypothetical protein [Frankia canadensis]SOU53666.1 conserved hypothetical protein [Frankia canadensis]